MSLATWTFVTMTRRMTNFACPSNLLVVEHQDTTMRTFAGNCEHILRRSAHALEIVLKRVDLINCDSVHRIMTVLL